jgi:cation diffusion facilitator family transporter
MDDIKQHYRKVRNILWLVLALNWAVAAAKIFYGLIIRSSSMTADGFHSTADGTSNLVGLVGIYFCARPVDQDHPYGHRKYETLFAMGIAAMLFIVAFFLVHAGIERMVSGKTPSVDRISFIVMLATMAVNVTVMLYEYRRGKQLGSDLLIVDSMHTRADIVTSLAVIVALVGVKLGYPVVDPVITLVIALFIAWSGVSIIRQESGILVDEVAIADTAAIENVVLRISGVQSCHKIRSRGRLDDVHLDLHVHVDGNMTLRDSHLLSHAIQEQVMAALPHVTDVLIHLEPQSPTGAGTPQE